MKCKTFLLIAASTFIYSAAYAARVDMNDPRRALATDDDLRIDAQLLDDTIGSGSTVNVTYQVQNDSQRPVAIANKVIDSKLRSRVADGDGLHRLGDPERSDDAASRRREAG